MTPPTHTHTEFELLQVFRLKFCGGRPNLSLNSEKVTCTSLAGEGVKVARSPLDRCHQLFFPLRCSSVAAFTILQSLDSPKGIFPNHSSKYFEVRRGLHVCCSNFESSRASPSSKVGRVQAHFSFSDYL